MAATKGPARGTKTEGSGPGPGLALSGAPPTPTLARMPRLAHSHLGALPCPTSALCAARAHSVLGQPWCPHMALTSAFAAFGAAPAAIRSFSSFVRRDLNRRTMLAVRFFMALLASFPARLALAVASLHRGGRALLERLSAAGRWTTGDMAKVNAMICEARGLGRTWRTSCGQVERASRCTVRKPWSFA